MFQRRLLAAIAAAVFSVATASPHAEAPLKGGQAPGWYRITLGKFEITALSDGTVEAPVEQLLHNISPARERALLEYAYLKSPVETSINGFLVNTGSKLVLIDSGAGGLMGPTLGKLVANLKASGYTPEQVDEIYITHLHVDHVGGITTPDGKAVFPNAVVRADAKDGDYWLSQKNLDAAPADMKGLFKGAMVSIKPYADAGRFKPFSGATELVSGISSIPTYGHTPGHTLYAVESEGQKLVVCGDLVHVAAVQFPQPTATWTEFDSKLALTQRLKQFADAATKGYYVALAHVAFPGIGRLRAEGGGYIWVPAVYSNAGQ
jgi:glyoxylase-like metal-dependent hydrolase (beta-lactamase superfamily II)